MTKRRNGLTDQELIKLWHESETLREVAKKCNANPGTVSGWGTLLRRRGVKLKHFKRGAKIGKTKNACDTHSSYKVFNPNAKHIQKECAKFQSGWTEAAEQTRIRDDWRRKVPTWNA